jgi:hypothetical protein
MNSALGQDQKGCLKDIFRVVQVVENRPGGIQHHGPMSPNQIRESTFIMPRHKLAQQLLVQPPADAGLGDELAKMTEDGTRGVLVHKPARGGRELRRGLPSLYSARWEQEGGEIFLS